MYTNRQNTRFSLKNDQTPFCRAFNFLHLIISSLSEGRNSNSAGSISTQSCRIPRTRARVQRALSRHPDPAVVREPEVAGEVRELTGVRLLFRSTLVQIQGQSQNVLDMRF